MFDHLVPGIAGGELRPPSPQHLIPYVVPDDVISERTLWVPNADGAPALLALLGRDADGRELGIVLLERPEHFRFRRAKVTVEEHQLERFATDFKRGSGALPFDSFRRGSDPPDFLVRQGDSEAGMDITQLVLEERVAAYAAFKELRTAAVMLGPRRFRRLRGQIVYVGLNEGAQKRIKDWVDDVLAALERLDPPATPNWSDANAGDGAVEFFEGGGLMAGHLRRAPTGSFYGTMGFDLALSYSSVTYQDDAWEILQGLVASHDKPGTQSLLIPVGAPLGDGLGFPSDIVPLGLAAAETDRAIEATHVRVVYVHVWATRCIFALRPGDPEWSVISPAENPHDLYVSGYYFAPLD